MKKKEVIFSEDNHKYKLVVNYGLHSIGEQEPYFSITSDLLLNTRNNFWKYIGGGCMHDEIRKHFPELEPLIKWHLCFEHSGPMHYIANALFWWKRSKRLVPDDRYTAYGPKALDYFKNTIVFGVVDSDSQYEVMVLDTPLEDIDKIRSFLNHRFHRMMNAFYEDMMKFEIY